MTPPEKRDVDASKFNREREFPFSLRIIDFQAAMQDVYDFLHEVNELLLNRGLRRLDDLMRPAAMSGFISDLLTSSLANHSRNPRGELGTRTATLHREGVKKLRKDWVYANRGSR